jgi:hypothetical protein
MGRGGVDVLSCKGLAMCIDIWDGRTRIGYVCVRDHVVLISIVFLFVS